MQVKVQEIIYAVSSAYHYMTGAYQWTQLTHWPPGYVEVIYKHVLQIQFMSTFL